MRSLREFVKCPRCGSPLKAAIAINQGESTYWKECIKCNTFVNTFIPQAHQAAVLQDGHTYVGNFGGYGSGKTSTSLQELYKHILITPNGNSVVGANVSSQYEQTIKRDFEADFPLAFVTDISIQKQYIDFKNGHRLMFRPFDDADKLRSYNITFFLILEASEVKEDVYTQLKSRLRNLSATIPKVDADGNPVYRKNKQGGLIPVIETSWLKGVIESNPSSGWIRTEVLLVADDIHKHGENLETYAVEEARRDPDTSAHITSSEVNEYLPPNFISALIKNKPTWWVSKFVYGSFMYAEGLVYPRAIDNVVPFFEIPPHWKRIVAFDYGLSDNAVFLFGAIDMSKGMLYIYKELVTKNRNIEELAKLYFEGISDIPSGGLYGQPIIDPKSGPKRDYEKKSLSDHFLEYGIAFKNGHINLDARIYRLNTYFESGRLKIFANCTYLISELKEYKFKAKNSSTAGWDDKPEDKNNHAINPLEWITMELPADPRNLVYGVFDSSGKDLSNRQKKIDRETFLWALSDPDERESEDNPWI